MSDHSRLNNAGEQVLWYVDRKVSRYLAQIPERNNNQQNLYKKQVTNEDSEHGSFGQFIKLLDLTTHPP